MQRKVFSLLLAFAAVILLSGTVKAQLKFTVALNTIQEVAPVTNSTARGSCLITLNAAQTQITVTCEYSRLSSNLTQGHIHCCAPPGQNAPVLFDLTPQTGTTSGTFTRGPFTLTAAQLTELRTKRMYVNLHTTNFPGGEIRGQIKFASTVTDADGDGRTDLTVFRQSANTFFHLFSINNSFQAFRFGSGTGDNYLPNHSSDFDGDGRFDPLLVKLNQTTGVASWSILSSLNNTISTVDWGNFQPQNGEVIVLGDYDGDARQDIAVFRRATGFWYIRQSSTGTGRIVQDWGAVGDLAIAGDYDGDGTNDLAVIRAISGQIFWFIRQSSNGQLRVANWGLPAPDRFFPFSHVDIDADGRQDLMVMRDPNPEANGDQLSYLILRSSDNGQFILPFGLDTDTRLFGDYDGDGRTDFVTRRTVNGVLTWFIALSSNNWNTSAPRVVQFGQTGDQFSDENEEPELFPNSYLIEY